MPRSLGIAFIVYSCLLEKKLSLKDFLRIKLKLSRENPLVTCIPFSSHGRHFKSLLFGCLVVKVDSIENY